jgi:uncharacterized membrane protein
MLKIKALFELLTLDKALNGLLTLYETFLNSLKLIKQMKPKIAIFALFMLLLVPSLVSAANIHGTIYDFELEKAVDTLVEINTAPKQSFVSKDGQYSFTVPLGEYIITAKQNGNTAEETITITDEGDYLIDLILFPDLSEEEDILAETELDVGIEYLEEKSYAAYYMIGMLILLFLVLAGIFYYVKSMKKQIKEEIKEIKDVEKEFDAELKPLIEFIRKEGGRTTQKDIRRNFPQSEAKVSLMIAELEELGKIKKIKKGRGNIITLR